MAASSSSKQVTLESWDGETFVVDEAVAMQSLTLKHMIEDGCADSNIPVANVTGAILSKVIEYCNKHTDSCLRIHELKAFDAEFMKVDQRTVFDIILAANYLNIKSLLDVACQTVADMVKWKTVEEIRQTFNLKNDFTPEEEAEVRRENAWSFD